MPAIARRLPGRPRRRWREGTGETADGRSRSDYHPPRMGDMRIVTLRELKGFTGMQQRRDDPIRISRWPVWSLPRSVLLHHRRGRVAGRRLGGRRAARRPAAARPALAGHAGRAGRRRDRQHRGLARGRAHRVASPTRRRTSTSARCGRSPRRRCCRGPLAGGVVVVIYGYLYLRVWRPLAVPPHRVLFSTATVVLAVQAAAAVIALGGRARSVPQPGRVGRPAGRGLVGLRRGEHDAGRRGDRAQRAEPQPGRLPAGARPRRRRGARVRHAVHGRAHRRGDGHVRPGATRCWCCRR